MHDPQQSYGWHAGMTTGPVCAELLLQQATRLRRRSSTGDFFHHPRRRTHAESWMPRSCSSAAYPQTSLPQCCISGERTVGHAYGKVPPWGDATTELLTSKTSQQPALESACGALSMLPRCFRLLHTLPQVVRPPSQAISALRRFVQQNWVEPASMVRRETYCMGPPHPDRKSVV